MTEGSNIILVTRDRLVLLFLRDDDPGIPFPNRWCLPGGHLEPKEAPGDCIVREIEEEMGIRLDPAGVHHLCTADRSYGREHTFWARGTFDLDDISLSEGQAVRWFDESEIVRTTLAYEDNDILAGFFGRLKSESLPTQDGGGPREQGAPS